MGCNCNNNLSESPDGVRAFLEEYKVPFCVSGVLICGAIGYRFYRKRKKKGVGMSDYLSWKNKIDFLESQLKLAAYYEAYGDYKKLRSEFPKDTIAIMKDNLKYAKRQLALYKIKKKKK